MSAMRRLGDLLHLVDPTLPIGGFNHSNGLETFVQQGLVNSKLSLCQYVETQMLQNWVFNDGAYLSLAFDAAAQQDIASLVRLDQELGASKIARESREGSFKLGTRLLKIFVRYEHNEVLLQFQQAIQQQTCRGFYPIVFAIIAASLGLPKSEALYAFYYNAIVGVVTNGVKLIPLSQMDGQDILVEMKPFIEQAVSMSEVPDKEWIGVATIMSDIRSMQHEQLYTRLYMS